MRRTAISSSGDALGIKSSDDIFLPPFMPPTWDKDAFLSSIDKMKQIPYQTLSQAHFGCYCGDEARIILDVSVETYATWWAWFDKHADRVGDIPYLVKAMRQEMTIGKMVAIPATFQFKALLGILTAALTITGGLTGLIDKLYFGQVLGMLSMGYRMSNKQA